MDTAPATGSGAPSGLRPGPRWRDRDREAYSANESFPAWWPAQREEEGGSPIRSAGPEPRATDVW